MGQRRLRPRMRAAVLAAFGCLGLICASIPAAEKEAASAAVRIGLVASFFRDTPEALMRTMVQPFGSVLESQTGIAGQLVPAADAVDLGRLLVQNKADL